MACNFQETWFKKLEYIVIFLINFDLLTFNFQFLDQVAYSRKLIKKIAQCDRGFLHSVPVYEYSHALLSAHPNIFDIPWFPFFKARS